jgi:hypothetical protein
MTGAADNELFDQLTWHDNTLCGLRLEIGDPDRGTWHSRLILDIDHILEWICGTDGRFQFRVAPATLTFEDVTDLKLALDQGDSGCTVALQLPTIDAIERERLLDQKICLDRAYWRWRIVFNQPPNGLITFGASSFHQRLRGNPVLTTSQQFPSDSPRPLPF